MKNMFENRQVSEGNLCKSCAFMGESKKLGVGDIPITSKILNLGPSLKYMNLGFYRPENTPIGGKIFFFKTQKIIYLWKEN